MIPWKRNPKFGAQNNVKQARTDVILPLLLRERKRKENTRKYWVSNNIECIVGVFSRRNEPKPVEDSGLSCM